VRIRNAVLAGVLGISYSVIAYADTTVMFRGKQSGSTYQLTAGTYYPHPLHIPDPAEQFGGSLFGYWGGLPGPAANFDGTGGGFGGGYRSMNYQFLDLMSGSMSLGRYNASPVSADIEYSVLVLNPENTGYVSQTIRTRATATATYEAGGSYFLASSLNQPFVGVDFYSDSGVANYFLEVAKKGDAIGRYQWRSEREAFSITLDSGEFCDSECDRIARPLFDSLIDRRQEMLFQESMWIESINGVMLPPVPEPETYAMMLAGLGLLSVVAKRRKKMAVTHQFSARKT
jgi:hypothetical protein